MDSTLVPVKNTVFVHSENKMPSEVVLARSLPSSLESSVSDSTSIRTTSTEEKAKDLPVKVQSKYLRHLRHTFLNVYRRIFSVILLVNIIALVCVLARNYEVPSDRLTDIATAASANTLVIILIRQDYVVNGIFRVCWSATFLPLRIRRILAKCYEFGGVHSGAAFSCLMWFMTLTALLTKDYFTNVLRVLSIMFVTYGLLFLLICIIAFAYPALRLSNHNAFEHTHRWAGWFSIGVFWAEILIFVNILSDIHHQSYALTLIRFPSFWLLILTTAHIILPWLRLRKLHVTAELLSSHAVRLHFTEPIPPFVVHKIAESPLGEWHPFACLPNPDGPGGSVIISRAGDFTSRTIDSPKDHYWVRGVPTTGVMGMVQLFRSAVIVTTGSGIGPCLGFVMDMKTTCRMLWSTPDPSNTFGQSIIDSVRSIDENAVIWDTKKDGRPDMVALAYHMYMESGAEAVFVLSNPKLTRKVVYGMESRGVPAYGPIWDS